MLYYTNRLSNLPEVTVQMSPLQRHRLVDRLGAYGSVLCAIHCALLPLVIILWVLVATSNTPMCE